MRIVKNFAFDYDGTIQAYEEKFKKFKSEFQEHGVLITEVTSNKVLGSSGIG